MIENLPSQMIDVQFACGSVLSNETLVQHWASATLAGLEQHADVVIRIVDSAESAKLNKIYRHREGPTNVLSFPMDLPADIPLNLLGDVVICAPVVEREAREQRKSREAHFAHMVVHGILHLLGFNHIEVMESRSMENQEIKIMESLGFSNPYQEVVTL